MRVYIAKREIGFAAVLDTAAAHPAFSHAGQLETALSRLSSMTGSYWTRPGQTHAAGGSP